MFGSEKEVINIYKYLKNDKGQSMVEFALAIIPFLAFIFGLITCSMWGTAAFLAQEASHEAARRYAIYLEDDAAQALGKAYLKKWGYKLAGKQRRQDRPGRSCCEAQDQDDTNPQCT